MVDVDSTDDKKTDSKDEDAPERRSSTASLRPTVKKMMMAARCAGKVAINNKIGSEPDGWFKDVALALQRGIAAEGRSTAQENFDAPELQLFTRCRTAFGFTPARYYATMGLQDGLTSPNLRLIGAASASGKSESFFFLSPDQQFMAKSCTAEDWSSLLRILPDYVEYIEAASARDNAKPQRARSRASLTSLPPGSVRGSCETLLPRYLGLYSLHVGDDKKPVRVLVMLNTFSGAMSIDRRYDLKGSTHGRKASKKEQAKKSPILKDIDWVASEPLLGVNSENLPQLLTAVQLDADFLARHGLMDYSLLVGVHDIEEGKDTSKEVMNVVTLRDSTRHCYLGIIDVLTPYRLRKRAETVALGSVFCGRDISCQHPDIYADRFYKFVEKKVFQPC